MGVIADLSNAQGQKKNGDKEKCPKQKNKRKPKEKLNKLDEMEATKIPDAEFKIIVIRMLKDLRGGMDDLSENLNKEIVSIKNDIDTIKKNQSEIKTTISEIKNTLEGINSRSYEAEV